jgi:ATP-binding cassette subfamily C (CFTR/MRP) protein 1
MAATVPIAIIAVYLVQNFYLKTSRQLRLLELEYKSPLYAQFTETMEGLLTIRSFGWESYFEAAELQSLDNSQRPVYLLLCIQRWLNLVLGFISAGIGMIVLTLAVLLPQSSSPGSLGVALTSVLGFNAALEGLIASYTGAETTIGSVTRTRDFEKDTPQEDHGDIFQDPDDAWPKGDIQFSGVTVIHKYVLTRMGIQSRTNYYIGMVKSDCETYLSVSGRAKSSALLDAPEGKQFSYILCILKV